MASRNPYQMDPFLAQGFSNLTKALIGDADTDYTVARTDYTNAQTNKLKTMLEYEIASEKARANASNAAAAASAALATLRKAETLTENQLRDPRVRSEIANAEATLALAKERLAGADANAALADQRNRLTDPMIASEEALANQRNAGAGADNALANQRNALTQPMVNSENALANSRNADAGASKALEQSRLADAMLTEAQTTTESDLRQPKIDSETALANDRNSSAELNKAKAKSERTINVPAGNTVIYYDENNNQKTFTAPETTKIDLDPGERVILRKPDGSTETFDGPAKPSDPKDAVTRLDNATSQMNDFFDPETGAFPDVDRAILRRIRAEITRSTKGKSVEEAATMIQSLLSQTYDGSTQYTVRTGRNFTVPAFVALAVKNAPNATADQVAELYGLSTEQAQRLINEMRAQ